MKKAEHRIIGAFQAVVLAKTLESPLAWDQTSQLNQQRILDVLSLWQVGQECYLAEFHRNLFTRQWHVSERLFSICVHSFTHCLCSLLWFSSLIWGTVYIKDPPAEQETWVWSLGREEPLEKGLATHSSIPAWRIPWTEEPRGLQSPGSQRAGQHLPTTAGLDVVLLWLTLLRVSLRWPLRWAFLDHWRSALWWSPCQKLEGICHCDFDFILFHYTKTANKEGEKWIFENSGWQAMDIFVILFFITFMHF